MATATLPRDLDVSILKRQVVYVTSAPPPTAPGAEPAAQPQRLAYFPLATLVFVTEVAGAKPGARMAATAEAGEMLRFRATQLSVPVELLIRHSTAGGWQNQLGQPAPATEGELITHRGFLEILTYWHKQKSGSQSVNGENFHRLERFVEYQHVIGEILWGVAPPAMPSVSATITAASVSAALPTSSNSASTVAHLQPVLTTTPVTLSVPPIGVPTIQDEIEAEAVKRVSKTENGGDVEMKDDVASAGFVIPPEGIRVFCTRFDGQDLPALSGRLVRIRNDLTLNSPMPPHPNQPISVLATLLKESATIAEYWQARYFTYTPEQKDANNPHSNTPYVHIAEVELDQNAPYIFPTDKIWRVARVNSEIERNPAINQIANPSAAFFPPISPSTPQLSSIASLWNHIIEEPTNIAVWSSLLMEVQLTHDVDAIRHAYHSFLKVFPTSATHWKALIEFELTHTQYAEIEKILPVALRTIPEIELWKMYLVYQKLVHSPPAGTPATDEQMRELNVHIENAYEYVLDHLGLDLNSGQVWRSYINFVRSIETRSQVEDQGKTATLRKLYQRVVGIPIQPKELATFWEDYQQFERSAASKLSSKVFMNKMIADHQNRFNNTHKEAIERRKKFHGIMSASVGSAYGQAQTVTQGSVHIANRASSSQLQQAKDATQIGNWLKYIRFEQRKVEGQDMVAYKSRVVLAYRQCLLYCRHAPIVWHDYLRFLMIPKMYYPAEQIKSAWKEWKEAMPYSILPTLIHADVEEELSHMAEAKALYEQLLQPLKQGEPLPESHVIKVPDRVRDEIKKYRAYEAEQEAARLKKEENVTSSATPASAAASSAASNVKEEPKEEKPEEFDGTFDIYKGELYKIHPIVFILLMRFIRRSEGVDASRKVFLLARRSPALTYHTYLYAAYAEHHVNLDLQKAQAIYAAGSKIYGEHMETYLLRYLDFLKETNDHNNLRLIFGRILLTESAESAEQSHYLSRKENAQMRKVQQANAAAAKDSATAAAAALNAKEQAALTNESADDLNIKPDDWYAHINGLLESSAPPPVAPTAASSSSGRNRHDREERDRAPAPLPSSTDLSLWSSYVNFERDTAGDLTVLVKAEEKRDAKLSVRYSFKLVHLIDRWRFMDLWPCSPQMRQTFEKVVSPHLIHLQDIVANELASEPERAAGMLNRDVPNHSATPGIPRQRGILITDPSLVANVKASVCRPDLTRLTLFSASSQQFDRASVRNKYGGVPEQILNVLSVLPPSHLCQGPYIHPQLIIDMLSQVQDTKVIEDSTNHSTAARPPPPSSSSSSSSTHRKRKQRDVDDTEDDIAPTDVNTPANDLYRKRQQQKLKAKQEKEHEAGGDADM